MNVERFRTLLLEERERVAMAIQHLHDDNAVAQGDEIPETGDADTASVTFDREMEATLEQNSSNVLADIDAALARIDDGTYGRCSRCGGLIDENRLTAMPYAVLCIDCKRKEERG